MKRLRTLVLVLLLSITPLFGISVNKAAAAGSLGHTWTGNAGDGKMSTAGNWNTNEVPDTGDNLTFPKGLDSTVMADLGAGVQLGSLLIGGTGSGDYIYQIDGVIRTKSIVAYPGGGVDIDAAVYLYPPVGTPATITIGQDSYMNLNSAVVYSGLDTLLISGPGSLNVNTVQVTGTVNTITFKDSKESDGGGIDIVGVGGEQPTNYVIDSADVYVETDFLNPTGKVSVDGDSSISFLGGETYSGNFSFADGAYVYGLGGQYGEPHAVVTLTGAVELLGDVQYRSDAADLKLTGNVSGSGKFTLMDGGVGDVIVSPAAGKANTSGQTTGVTKPPVSTITITDSNTDILDIYENNVVIVNGARGDTTVYDGGVLKGSGKVGVLDVKAGGKVAPGQSPGCLTAGNTTFTAGSILEAEIAGKTVCSEYDQLKVVGTVNLGGATLETKLLNDFKPQTNDSFIVVDNDGTDAITGTFKDLAEGATFTVNGYVFKVTYKGGDGNDAALTVQTIPASPNTGVQLLAANPLLTLGLTVLSAGTLFVLARRYSFVNKK